MAVPIKILFEFTRFFKPQNIEFISIQVRGEIIKGLLTYKSFQRYPSKHRVHLGLLSLWRSPRAHP